MLSTRLHFVGAILACTAIALSWPARGADYQYDVVDYPSAIHTRLSGVNDRGQVVGWASPDEVNFFQFVYDLKTKVFTLVQDAPGSSGTFASSINDAGQMVGVTFVDPSPYYTMHGFIRDRKGTYFIFRNPNWDSAELWGINNKGLVIGDYADASSYLNVAFVFDSKAAKLTEIRPEAFGNTFLYGINSQSQIVGESLFFEYELPPGVGESYLGFLRNPDGSTKAFRVNGLITHPRAINDSGVIVGYVTDREPSRRGGFAIKLGASPVYEDVTVADSDLLRIPGYALLHPYGITSSGTIIGSAVANDLTFHGFVATPLPPRGP